MLILTRRIGETLMIGDEVSLTILGVKGNQIRIGVNAPKEVAVHREEIYKKIQREKLIPLDSSIVDLHHRLESLNELQVKNLDNCHNDFYSH